MERRRVDRRLQVEAEVDVVEEEQQRPLVLLVAARRAEGEIRVAAPEGERGRERRARPLPGASEFGRPSSSQNICARVPSGKPSAGTTGELRSQPPLGVAETMFPCRSTTSRWTVSLARVGSPAPRSARRPGRARAARRDARPQLRDARRRRPACRRSSAYSLLSSRSSGTSTKSGSPYQRLAVGERELGALDDGVDELALSPQRGEVEALEQRELLQEDRALPPGAASCRRCARGSRATAAASSAPRHAGDVVGP